MDSRFEDRNYARDPRNCAPGQVPMIEIEQSDGSYLEVELPWRWAVCPVCDGKGTHVNPSIDCNGISAEEFAEDPDFHESYLRGDYDQECNRCGGRTTVPQVDVDRLSPKEAEAWREHERAERQAWHERCYEY